ncbi:hypothetical protein [Streptomyces yangpuensis]|uniref:hypothetical protein n=1 Tax=Streptomyces yangpuensis TaxID=1648182 RepID=UPI0035DBC5C9
MLGEQVLQQGAALGVRAAEELLAVVLQEVEPVTYQMVRAHIATLRRAPADAPPWPPSVCQVTGWLTRHPTALTEEERPD